MSCFHKSNCVRLFISPCPNDTFAFYGLLHGKVDCRGLDFDAKFEDIERLNSRAIAGQGDVIKASIAVAPLIQYEMLSSGAALGRGNGPIVVRGLGVGNKIVAIPGRHTTAALLFKRYFKGYELREVLFSDIAGCVERGEVGMGVLIHEGRFTFEQRGLEKVADLGQMWEQETGLMLPLGGIFASNAMEPQVRRSVELSVRHSVEWALAHPKEPMDFVRSHARELETGVLHAHIEYFVNSYTVDMGTAGRQAIAKLLACDK